VNPINPRLEHTLECYLYTPLPPILPQGIQPPSTRLMILYPGKLSDTIRCSLIITNLGSSPPYEALSYYWGPPAGSVKPYVLCDSCPISITPNLAGALKNLRGPERERILWVDAIRID
jgi:hypothetical protein